MSDLSERPPQSFLVRVKCREIAIALIQNLIGKGKSASVPEIRRIRSPGVNALAYV